MWHKNIIFTFLLKMHVMRCSNYYIKKNTLKKESTIKTGRIETSDWKSYLLKNECEWTKKMIQSSN